MAAVSAKLVSETLAAAQPKLAAAYRPLGAFRFGLALLVVIRHFQILLIQPGPLLLSRAGIGIVAVAVFFVISGFVVAEASIVFYAGRPLAFVFNRLLRVVPAYWAALTLTVCVHAVLWHAGRLRLWDYTLAGSPLNPRLIVAGILGVVPGFHGRMLGGDDFEFIPFAWSLRVEMAFYAAACLVLLASAGHGRVLPWMLGLALAACGLFLLRMRPGLLSSGPMFLLGVSACLLLQKPDKVRWAYAAACLLLTPIGFVSYGQRGQHLLVLQLGLLSVLLTMAAGLVQWRTCPWRHWDRALGALSYPLYLNHYVVGIVVYDVVDSRGLGIFVASIAIAVSLSWLMAKAIELPLEGARSRIRGAFL